MRSRALDYCEAHTPWCVSGRHYGDHVHHIRRRSQGGKHEPDNGLFVCFRGHDWIHAHPAEAADLGFLAHRGKVTGKEEP